MQVRYSYLKNYQGNNSVVLNQNGVVQQINHYYPYGSLMGEGFNASSQSYRYGGKELVYLDFRYIKILLKKSMLEDLFELE